MVTSESKFVSVHLIIQKEVFIQKGSTPFRKNYAGIGYTYDFARDAFILT
jgi:hypothetical protein